MSSSDDEFRDSEDAATEEKAALVVAPTPMTKKKDTPAAVAPNPVPNANPLSSTPTATDPTP